MLTGLTPEEEDALVRALRPLFRLMAALPRDRDIGYQGPVEAVSLYPVIIGTKPDGDAVIGDPSAQLDGTPSLCWREWARVDADEILAQSSRGPQAGGVKLVDVFRRLASGGRQDIGGLLLDIFRKAGWFPLIKERGPAYILSMMVLVILAQRLAILNTADAAIWLLTGATLLTNLVTQAAGQERTGARPPADPPAPPVAPPGPPPPLPDLRDDRPE